MPTFLDAYVTKVANGVIGNIYKSCEAGGLTASASTEEESKIVKFYATPNIKANIKLVLVAEGFNFGISYFTIGQEGRNYKYIKITSDTPAIYKDESENFYVAVRSWAQILVSSVSGKDNVIAEITDLTADQLTEIKPS